jgi:hypothetical protein
MVTISYRPLQSFTSSSSSRGKRSRFVRFLGVLLVISFCLLTFWGQRRQGGRNYDPAVIQDATTLIVGSSSSSPKDDVGTATTSTSTSTTTSETVFYNKPKRTFPRNRFTLDDFVVLGVNLARFGFEDDDHHDDTDEHHHHHHHQQSSRRRLEVSPHKYQLFDTFDIAPNIQGHEHWLDLVRYHRDLQRPSLIFYMDKVAQKRYMAAVGYPVPKTFALYYDHELVVTNDETSRIQEQQDHIRGVLPQQASYVVKPTHKSSSSGVWLVRYDSQTQRQTMGYSGHPTVTEFDETAIAQRVVKDLHDTAATFESWALLHAPPGFVVEERYSSWDSDVQAAYEFKTFTIWGRVYMAYLKRGNGPYLALVYRNGTILNCQNTNTDWKVIPDMLQFDQVVTLAEQLGKNKDMFRVDIFVGLPSDEVSSSTSSSAGEADPNNNNKSKPKLRVVVSETEFHPTSAFKDPEILEEAARLWMAGYKMNIYSLIPNTEVPKAFLDNGFLSEEDAMALSKIPEAQAWSTT